MLFSQPGQTAGSSESTDNLRYSSVPDQFNLVVMQAFHCIASAEFSFLICRQDFLGKRRN